MKTSIPKFIKFIAILFALGFIFFSINVHSVRAFACTASVTGKNWSTTGGSPWTNCESGGTGAPLSTDTVTINGGITVTVDTGTAVAASVVIGTTSTGTAVLNFASSGSPVLTVGGTVTIGASSGTFGATLDMTNSSTLVANALAVGATSGTKTFTKGAGTVQMAANNSIPTTIFTSFNNLTISGGTTTLASAITVGGALAINNGATLTLGAFTLGVTGTTTVGQGTSGVLQCPSAASCTGLKTFTGAVTVSAGGTFNLTTSSTNSTTLFSAGITQNSSVAFNAGTGAAQIVGNVAGTGTGGITFGGTLTVNSGTTTNNYTGGVVTVTGTLTCTGTWAQANGSSLTLGATTPVTTVAGFSASAATNTVTFTNTATMPIPGAGTASTYSNVVINGSGKTITTAAVTVGGTLTITAGTLSHANSAFTVTGATSVTGTFSNVTGVSAVTFNNTVDIQSGGSINFTTSVNPAVNFANNITTHTGASTTNFGTGATIFTASSTISGPVAVTIGAVTINSGVTVTNSLTSVGLTMASLTMAAPTAANSLALSSSATTTISGATTFNPNVSTFNSTITMNGSDNFTTNSLVMTNAPTSTGVNSIACGATGTGTLTVSTTAGITGNSTSTGWQGIDLSPNTCKLSISGLLTLTGGTNATGVAKINMGAQNATLAGGVTFSGTTLNESLINSAATTISYAGTWTSTVVPTLTLNSGTVLKDTGTATLGTTSGLSWPGNLWVSSGTTTLDGTTITINGTTEIGGTLADASGAATKTFTNTFTVDSGGTVSLNTATVPVTSFGAGIVQNSNNAITLTGASTITGNISGTGTGGITFGSTLTVAGSQTTTNSSAAVVTVTSTLILTGNWTQANGSSLTFGAATPTSGVGTFSASTATNTVKYSAASSAIINTTYSNLTIGASISTGAENATVANVLTITSTATFTPSSGTITMNGGNILLQGGTLTFFNFTTATGATVATIGGGFGVAGTMTVGSTSVFTPAAIGIISGAGTLTGSGTVQVTRTTATADFASQYTITTKTLTNLTVEYTNSGETINALTYGNAGAGGLKISAAITSATSTATVAGVLTTTAAFAPTGGTITLNTGSSIVTSGSAPTFFNLALATSSSVTSSSNFSIASTLTVPSTSTFDTSTGGTVTISATTFTIAATPGTIKFSGLTIASTPATQPTASFSVYGTLTVNSSITFAPTGGTVTMAAVGSSIANNGGATTNLVLQGLTIAATPTAQSQYNTSFSVAGTLTVNSGITFAPSGGTITIAGGTISNSGTALTFNNLTTTGTVTAGSSSSFTVGGNFTISSGTFTSTSNTLSIFGTFTNNGTFTHNGGKVSFTGTSGTINIPANATFNNLDFSPASGTPTFQPYGTTSTNPYPANAVVGWVRQNCTGYTNCFTSLYSYEVAWGGISFGGCTTGDLVCANVSAVAKIDGPWTVDDNPGASVNFTGWNTDATHYIQIYTTPSARAAGGAWDNTKYRLVVSPNTFGDALSFAYNVNYFRVDGLQIKIGAQSTYEYAGINMNGGFHLAGDVRISNCIIQGTSTQNQDGIGSGISSTDTDVAVPLKTVRIWNNIVYGMGGTDDGIVFNDYLPSDNGTVDSIIMYNNTISGGDISIQGGLVALLKNTILQYSTSTSGYNVVADTTNSTDNLSNNTDAPGTNPQNSKTLTFSNLADGNLHLASTDTSAIGQGANLSSDSTLPFSADIQGQTRGTPWDLGAIEYQSNGTGGPVTIASAGTIANPTKNSVQTKMFFDGTNWWSFYMKSGTANTLFYAYSPDLINWTEASVALYGTVVQDGGTVTTTYDSTSKTFLVTYYDSVATDTNYFRYMRGTISGTTVAWGANTVYGDNSAGQVASIGSGGDYTTGITVDSSNIPTMLIDDGGGNETVQQATNAIGTSFADTGWSTISGMNGNTHIQNYQLKSALFPLASKNLLEIVEDSSDYVVEAALYNATTGYWDASYTPIMNTGAPGTSIVTNWGAVKVSNTNVSFLAQLSTNTFSFQTYSGSAWSTLTAPSWPTSGLATNSQVALTTDGINVWAFVIRGDANKTVSYNKYDGTAWGGWTDLTTTAKTRSYITASYGNGSPVAMWSEVNGSNYNIEETSINSVFSGSTSTGNTAITIAGNLTVNGGTLSSAQNITVNGGSATGTGTVNMTGGTFNLLGTGNFGGNTTWTFNNLSIGGSSSTTTDTFASNAVATVSGNFTINSGGTFVAAPSASSSLKILGNFTNNGTFTNNGGTVAFAPTSTSNINGSNGITFNNLTVAGADGAGKTITFENGKTYVISGAFNVAGQNGAPLSLLSASPGSQWTITSSGTSSINYLSVKDSACSGGNNIATTDHVFNLGNNGNCWSFISLGAGGFAGVGAAPIGGTGSGGGNTGGGADEGNSNTAWYSTGGTWLYRKAITIDHTKVSNTVGETYTNLPVLISWTTDANLAAGALSTGNDILFTSSNGLTKLNHEIEKYVSGTGELEAWVNLGTGGLSTTSDTTLYMYYGNASASNQQNITGTWNSNYKGVWHLKNGGNGLTSADSTSVNNGTNSGTTSATGKIAGGTSFNGTSDYINAGTNSSLKITGDITISAWINPTSFGGNSKGRIVDNDSDGSTGYIFLTDNSNVTNGLTFGTVNNGYCSTGNVISTGSWQYVTVVYNSGADTANFYVNGSLVGSVSTCLGHTISSSSNTFYIGDDSGNDRQYAGALDEINVSNIQLSADWIATSYANQNSPSTFYKSVSVQQTNSGGGSAPVGGQGSGGGTPSGGGTGEGGGGASP